MHYSYASTRRPKSPSPLDSQVSELARDSIENTLLDHRFLGCQEGLERIDGFLAAAAKTIDETAEPLPYAIG
ncbi:hypothetical protein [Marichromatium sp. AB32]|uniref:hypothetical protein n=1 Tax=Marichromatium sp. AB32 TaxID=2483363 RepID=UPI0011CDC59B|nr:hypothetical protein [Marichromatium sp. AB32]MBO8087739.1 hypothetical protein [Marichromatium sp.]